MTVLVFKAHKPWHKAISKILSYTITTESTIQVKIGQNIKSSNVRLGFKVGVSRAMHLIL